MEREGDEPLDWDDGPPNHMSETFRYYLGGLLAASRELSYLFAPYVNSYKRYQPGSWAPTAIVWGRDNRTCGLRLVGHGAGFRVESRIPGGDCNPYLAYAATIAAGLHGIEHGLDPGRRVPGQRLRGRGRAPRALDPGRGDRRARGSELAAKAFGEDVHFHLVNTARQEWAASNRVVTDWELRRSFELA